MLGDRHPDPALANGITRMFPKEALRVSTYKRGGSTRGMWDGMHSLSDGRASRYCGQGVATG